MTGCEFFFVSCRLLCCFPFAFASISLSVTVLELAGTGNGLCNVTPLIIIDIPIVEACKCESLLRSRRVISDAAVVVMPLEEPKESKELEEL